MAGINFSVHPLFFLFGLYFAFTGRIFVFLIYTFSAVIHELGHSFIASSLGYKLNKITLMPFGAVVKGEIKGLSYKDEIKIALAGPCINLAVGIFFVALWWIYPEIYSFTDIIVFANFSMATVNLIPAYPLDGGRVLFALLAEKLGQVKAEKICKILGGILGGILLVLFMVTVFYQVNFSLLFFSAFVLFGAFEKNKENVYVKAYLSFSEENLKKGLPYKKYAFDKSVKIKRLITCLDENALNEITVFDGENEVGRLSPKKISEIIEKGDLYSSLEKYI